MPTHELKFSDIDLTAVGGGTGYQLGKCANPSLMANTPAIILLNGLVKGSDATQRIGRQVLVKKVIARLTLYMPDIADSSTSPNWPTFVRIMLVYDMQTNATLLTLADLFNDSLEPNALQNLNNRDRFKVIKDKVYNLNKTAKFASDASDMGACRFVKIYKRLNLTTVYNDQSNGTVGDIQTGSLYLIALANGPSNSNTAAEQLQLYGYTRIRYSDC